MTAAVRHSDPPSFLLSSHLNILTSIAPQLRIGFHSDAACHAPGEAGSVITLVYDVPRGFFVSGRHPPVQTTVLRVLGVLPDPCVRNEARWLRGSRQ
jgi:hypothetical protein